MRRMTIADNLKQVRERIAEACKRSGRNVSEVAFVLVTKEVEVTRIQEAYELGVRDFGENRVQQLVAKKSQLAADIRWHMIGHLQTNKVKPVVGEVVLIHSLDRLSLAMELQKQAEKQDREIPVLAQVNFSAEETKSGFEPEEAEACLSQVIRSCNRLNFQGLMTIGPNTREEGPIRSSFSKLRELQGIMRKQFPQFDWHYLSMGMSLGFEIAVEEGANLLRIGTAIFGPRT